MAASLPCAGGTKASRGRTSPARLSGSGHGQAPAGGRLQQSAEPSRENAACLSGARQVAPYHPYVTRLPDLTFGYIGTPQRVPRARERRRASRRKARRIGATRAVIEALARPPATAAIDGYVWLREHRPSLSPTLHRCRPTSARSRCRSYQVIRNQQVRGSIPRVGSNRINCLRIPHQRARWFVATGLQPRHRITHLSRPSARPHTNRRRNVRGKPATRYLL